MRIPGHMCQPRSVVLLTALWERSLSLLFLNRSGEEDRVSDRNELLRKIELDICIHLPGTYKSDGEVDRVEEAINRGLLVGAESGGHGKEE